MADANAPEKNWWRWFEKDTLISIVSALGLDVIFELIKKEGPVVAWTHFKKDLDEKILTDKRAEMLREFRKMEDAGINIDNLRRRHAESMDRSKVDRWAEYRFVQLLCKIQPPDPANPQKVRPPIVPGKPGKPQNDRQADLKWLNDQCDPGDPRFDQMMHLLDHDVVTQMFQIGCDRTARFLKNLRGNLKVGGTNVAQWLRTHFGALGDWIVDTAEATLDLIVRFFRWLSGSWLRVVAVAVISLPILLFVALIVSPIRRRVFPWLGIAIGVLLVTVAYYLLVPTSLDKTLSLAFLMLLAAAFFLWKFAPIRNIIFGLLVLFTLIFFLGGRTAAKEKIVEGWPALHSPKVSTSGRDSGFNDEKQPPLRPQPYTNQVCDDALGGPAPVATTHESLIDDIPQGCFGSDTQLPSPTAWPGWCYQPYPRNPIAPGWQVTFQFLDGEGRVWATKGPYGPTDKPSFQYFPGRFRLQGSGIIRFYPGNCT